MKHNAHAKRLVVGQEKWRIIAFISYVKNSTTTIMYKTHSTSEYVLCQIIVWQSINNKHVKTKHIGMIIGILRKRGKR